MGKIFKIPGNNSFLHSLVRGYIKKNYGQYNNIIILPSNIDIKLIKEVFSIYYDHNYIIPKFTTISDYLSLDDPFIIFPEYLKLPLNIEIEEFKLEILTIFTNWQKTEFYKKNYSQYNLNYIELTKRFASFYLQIEEHDINPQNLCSLTLDNLPISERVIIDFLYYFELSWQKFKIKHNKVSHKEKQNLILKFKTKFLAKITDFDNIILAGTTGVNPLTMNFISALIQHQNGIFIYHEKIHNAKIINNINPNLLIEKLESNLKNNNIKYWDKKQNITEKYTEYGAKNLNEEADFIAHEIKKSKDKKIILTNNQELRNLILFKVDKYIISHKSNLNNQQKLFKIFYQFINEKNPHKISALFDFYFDLKINISLEKINKFNNKIEVINYIATIVGNEYLLELENLKNNIIKISKLQSHNKDYLNILDLISPEQHIIYFEDDDLLIIQPKELRLINNKEILLADINQQSWQSKIDKIFNLAPIKNKIINLQNIRDSQIASDFLHLINSENVTFTQSKNHNNKENLIYIFYLNYKNQFKLNHVVSTEKYHKYHNENNILIIPKEIKKHDFYVTEIEKLLKNPYNIYAAKILKLRKKSTCFAEEKNKIFGILVHKSLDYFITNINNKNNNINNKKINELNNYFANLLENYSVTESIKYTWLNRFQLIAKDFVIKSKELNILSEYLAETYLNDNDIKLKAKIDYLIYNNKKIKIIDYKTGTTPNHNDIKSGLAGQLILELFILTKLTNADEFQLEYWQLLGKSNLAIQIKKLESAFIKNSLKIVQTNITKLIDKYQNNDLLCFPYKNNSSKYDEFFHLARIDKS